MILFSIVIKYTCLPVHPIATKPTAIRFTEYSLDASKTWYATSQTATNIKVVKETIYPNVTLA